MSLEIIGIGNDTLIDFAKELCNTFSQWAVLVKSYETGNITSVGVKRSDDSAKDEAILTQTR